MVTNGTETGPFGSCRPGPGEDRVGEPPCPPGLGPCRPGTMADGSPAHRPSGMIRSLLPRPDRRAVDGVLAQLLLDPEELIVLGDPVGAAGAPGLDLAGVGSHGDVG